MTTSKIVIIALFIAAMIGIHALATKGVEFGGLTFTVIALAAIFGLGAFLQFRGQR